MAIHLLPDFLAGRDLSRFQGVACGEEVDLFALNRDHVDFMRRSLQVAIATHAQHSDRRAHSRGLRDRQLGIFGEGRVLDRLIVEAVRLEGRVDALGHAVLAVLAQPVLEQRNGGHDGLHRVAFRGEAEAVEMAEAGVALEERVRVRLAVGRQSLDRDGAHQAAQYSCQLPERRIVLLAGLVVFRSLRELCDVAIAQVEIVLLGRRRISGRGQGEQAEQGERSHCKFRLGAISSLCTGPGREGSSARGCALLRRRELSVEAHRSRLAHADTGAIPVTESAAGAIGARCGR
ncbi:hypothetical protein ACVWW7_007459 [Bradyrhizobium sp. LM6.9]